MSVKIEVLDYVFGSFRGPEMLSNSEFSIATDWTAIPTGCWTISGGYAIHNNNVNTVDYLQYSNVNFVQGLTYMIKLNYKNVTQGHIILANHLAGGANGFDVYTLGDRTITYTWVQGSQNTNKLSIAAMGNWDGEIDWIHVSSISGIDWKNSVVGVLDVTDHTDFPLSLTFQISDIRDLTSSSGDYSKSFKIPATKNNNNILHHIYDAKAGKVLATIKKPCRIIVDNLYSLVGTITVKGIGLHGEAPDYYECVFFGSNLGWAKDLDLKYMNEIEWGTSSEDLYYNKTTIMATWQHADCAAAEAASAPPIVYPVVSYGDYNAGGDAQTIQLFDTQFDHEERNGGSPVGGASYAGYDNNNIAFGTFPQSDWRPAVFVKTTLDKIFSNFKGYTISSNFMNTDMFKKLVWLLPNFKRDNESQSSFYDLNSFDSTFANGVTNVTNTIATGTADNPNDPTGANHNNVPFGANISESGLGRINLGGIMQDDGAEFFTGNSRIVFDLDAVNLTVVSEYDTSVDYSTNEITIGSYGDYTIELTGIISRVARVLRGNSDPNKKLTELKTCVNIEVLTVGQTAYTIIASSEQTHNPKNTYGTAYVTDTKPSASGFKSQPDLSVGTATEPLFLNTGDKIRLTFGVEVTDADDTDDDFILYHFFRTAAGGSLKVMIEPEIVSFGQKFDLSHVIDPKYKQIDFIKGIAHAFNLMISTDQVKKIITIEPFDDFYLPYGSSLDWTSKLDRSKETSDQWVKNELRRRVVFKYKTDSKDAMIEHRGMAYFDGVLDEYPYIDDLPPEFEKGETVFENPFFAGTYNTKDYDTQGGYTSDPLVSPCLWQVKSTSASSREDVPKGFDFEPRLLYWNKYSPTTSDPKKYIECQTWANGFNDFLFADDSVVIPTPPNAAGSGWLGGVYPQATSIDRESTTSPVLSYGNVWRRSYDADANTYGSPEAGKGLYDTYYKKMFEMVKRNPRVRTAFFNLKVSDIVGLDFRRLVYIDGVYWRVNRVLDYSPNKNQTTKVELVQWIELGVFAASSPAFGVGSTSTRDYGVSFYEYGNEANPNDLEGQMLDNG
jgi:hypothetical protein